jgi:hypothetical protein
METDHQSRADNKITRAVAHRDHPGKVLHCSEETRFCKQYDAQYGHGKTDESLQADHLELE